MKLKLFCVTQNETPKMAKNMSIFTNKLSKCFAEHAYFGKYWPTLFDSKEDKGSYKWCRMRLLANGLNDLCNKIGGRYLKVRNESASAIFWTTPKGNLTHFPCIFHKSEPLGPYFNTVACYFTGLLILLEIKG